MTKPQLRDKVDDTAPADDQEGDGAGPSSPSRGELQLEADAQKGGHSFTLDGKANRSDVARYKHEHLKKKWKQSGGSSYKEYMRANLKKHGGDMKAAADAYKQSGGHYARAGGDATAAEKAKYKHGHAGMNPAVGESNVYEKRASPKKKKTAAKEPAKAAAPKTKYAKADESIFDTLDDTKAKATAKEAAAAATPKQKAKRRTPAPAPPVKAKRGMTDAQKKKGAKDRLKAGGYTNSWFKYRDGAFAAGIFDTKTISTNYRRVAELKKRDDYDAQNARDDREMVESESAEANAVATAPVKAALKKAGKIKKKQSGSGEQSGDGFMNWLSDEHKKHPFLTDTLEGAALGIGTIATGGLADLAVGGVAALADGAEAGLADAGEAAAEHTFGGDLAANQTMLDTGGTAGADASGTAGSRAAQAARDAGKSLCSKLPGRDELAKTMITAGATDGVDDEITSEEPPPPPPPPDHSAENADAYSRNFAALYGDHESGAGWG